MKTLAYCWGCGKEHDVTNTSAEDYGLKCECGDYVISPSGKMQIRLIPENNKDRRLLKKPLKVYQIFLEDEEGWIDENLENFRCELEAANDDYRQYEPDNKINIDFIMKCLVLMEPGDEFSSKDVKFKCFEMEESEFNNLPEFAGW